jgi:hypothetical protein
VAKYMIVLSTYFKFWCNVDCGRSTERANNNKNITKYSEEEYIKTLNNTSKLLHYLNIFRDILLHE